MSDDHFDADRSTADGGRDAPSVPEDAIDTVCRALGDRHRRRVVGYLMETDDGVATLDELLDPVAPLSLHRRERLRVALHQNHLGQLEDANIVEYDRRSGTVRYRPHRLAEELLGVVEAASTHRYREAAESSGN